LDPQGNTFNDVAYQMANADLKLPLALDYAKKAARAAEQESQKITLSDLKLDDLKSIQKLAAYWDTLGWVNDKMSNLDEAEHYLRAAWTLTQDGMVASHLCQVYERLHKIEPAIQTCRLAVYRIPMSEQLSLSQYEPEMHEAQKRLEHLTGGRRNRRPPEMPPTWPSESAASSWHDFSLERKVRSFLSCSYPTARARRSKLRM
jgi:tetratricopeptide (TPR) repeat protein